ncbi:MAG: hypothetical protein ABSF58_06840 [Solirubrobacteraceae bacterium]
MRRTKVLRRRVAATALVLLVCMWATVLGLGSLGASTTKSGVSATLADVRTKADAAASKSAATRLRAKTTGADSAHTASANTASVTATATTSETTTASTSAGDTSTAASSVTAVTTSQS